MRKGEVKNITISILFGIAELIDELLEPVSYQTIKSYGFGPMRYDSRRIYNNLHSLERRGYIKLNSKSSSVELTNKGRIKLVENSSDLSIDGRWRMVSYDIPEKLVSKRIQFCRSLKRIGFKQLQKSLWVCPYMKASEIGLIISELKLEKYVAYLLVEKSDIEKYLKKLFPEV